MIILTGSSGFLGKAISKNYNRETLITVARNNSDVICDLSIEIPKLGKSDLVIHCAGKAHSVPKNDKERKEFFDVNVKGTENLLKGLEQNSFLPRSFIYISTVAVYGCESGIQIDEEHPLNALDSYGLSKIQAEKLVQHWCLRHSVICTILRLPLLVGVNPPGNLGAMIKGIKKGYYINIAGGKAKKSMVLVDDVSKIIPVVANIGGIYNLTDGDHPSFKALSSRIAMQMGKYEPLDLPLWIVKMMARIGDCLDEKFPINSKKIDKIISNLTFDDSKARLVIGWNPKPVLNNLILE